MPKIPKQSKRIGREPSAEVKAIEKKLHEFRLTKTDLSQVNVSKQMQVSRQYVNNIEKGEAGISIDTLYLFCNAMGAEPQIKIVKKRSEK